MEEGALQSILLVYNNVLKRDFQLFSVDATEIKNVVTQKKDKKAKKGKKGAWKKEWKGKKAKTEIEGVEGLVVTPEVKIDVTPEVKIDDIPFLPLPPTVGDGLENRVDVVPDFENAAFPLFLSDTPSDVPSNAPSDFPSDFPSDVPSDPPSMTPSIQ